MGLAKVFGLGAASAGTIGTGDFLISTGVGAPLGIALVGLGLAGVKAMEAAGKNIDRDDDENKEDSGMSSLVPYRRPYGLPYLPDDTSDAFLPLRGTTSPLVPLAIERPFSTLRHLTRKEDEDFLADIAKSNASSVLAMVERHPSPTRLRVKGSVRRTLFGGTKFKFDAKVS